MDWKHMTEEIKRFLDYGAVTHYNRRKSKETFYPPEEEED